MVILIGFVLTAICLVVLALPFLQRSQERALANSDWRTTRQRLYDELGLLEQEWELGHLSQADYQKQAEEIRWRAADLVRQEELEARAAEAASGPARGQGRRASRQAPRRPS